jgi:vacuolar-type H+-ATPase subunit I/STV1
MANLKYETIQCLEELFDMESGYVLDFSNSSFQRFIKGIISIDIYNDKGYEDYCSKANKLRQIFETESNSKVVKLISALLNYYEDYKLKNNNLTDYDKKKIDETREVIKDLEQENDEKIAVSEELDELIQKISTRNAQFCEMALDEKLKEVGNLIEYLLKKDGKFITLNYDYISLGFIKENDVKRFRKKIQCFRHSSQESLKERRKYTENQKQFMVEVGIVMCNLIYNELN